MLGLHGTACKQEWSLRGRGAEHNKILNGSHRVAGRARVKKRRKKHDVGETKRGHHRGSTMGWTPVITGDCNLTGPGENDVGNQESRNVNKDCGQKAQQEQKSKKKLQTPEKINHHSYKIWSWCDITFNRTR